MATLERFAGGKVDLDANVFIYAAEAVAEYSVAVEALFSRLDDGSIVAATSELTLADVLAKPFETGRHDIARIYEDMLTPSAWLAVLPVDRTTLIEAARGSDFVGLWPLLREGLPAPCREAGFTWA